MNQQEAELALQAWASFERDELVRAAHEAGVTKTRIHTITGLARTTIDRILETPMPNTSTDRLAAYLVSFTEEWPRPGYSTYFSDKPLVSSGNSAQDIASILFKDAEFKALRLATMFSSSDVQFLISAVEALAPPPYRQDIMLLVEALQLAVTMQQDEARAIFAKRALIALGLGAIGAIIATSGNS